MCFLEKNSFQTTTLRYLLYQHFTVAIPPKSFGTGRLWTHDTTFRLTWKTRVNSTSFRSTHGKMVSSTRGVNSRIEIRLSVSAVDCSASFLVSQLRSRCSSPWNQYPSIPRCLTVQQGLWGPQPARHDPVEEIPEKPILAKRGLTHLSDDDRPIQRRVDRTLER